MLSEITDSKNSAKLETNNCSSTEPEEETIGNNELTDEEIIPTFGNVTIDDSNEVHFGNRTVYHGSVEIKQILYTNNSNNNDNSAIVINNQIQTVSNNLNNYIINDDDRDVDVITKKSGCTVQNDNSATLNGVDNKNNDVFNKQTTQKDNNSHSGRSFLKGLSSTKKIILASFSTLLVLVILVILILLLTLPSSSPQDIELIFVSREEWKAKPPKAALTQLPTLPVGYIIIHHTATENCSTTPECTLHTQKIQEFHMGGREWDDIGYNFLVGGDGKVYEARGWKTQGAHTLGYNAVSLGIAFIGTFNSVQPAEAQLKSCKKLIEFGVKKQYVIDKYKLLGARQLHTTQSPGNELYKEIKTWSHWVAAP